MDQLKVFAVSCVILLGCSGETGTQPTPGLMIVAGAEIIDTVGAFPTQQLVIELRGPSNAPSKDALVEFSVRGGAASSDSMGVRTDDSGSFGEQASMRTDDQGRARASFRFGIAAGARIVDIAAPDRALTATSQLVVRPGTAVQLRLAPRDTAVLIAGSYQIRASATDVYGNVSNEANYMTTSSFATVNSTGRVSGITAGRVMIRGEAGSLSDSVFVSVVPDGTIAALFRGFGQSGIAVFRTDGSQMVVLSSLPLGGLADFAWPSWAPSGDRLAYVNPSGLFTIDMMGAIREIVSDTDVSSLLGGLDQIQSDTAPQYSSDGTWIYFVASESSPGINPQTLVRSNIDGSVFELVSSDLNWSIERSPSPEPGGRILAYQVNASSTGTSSSWSIRFVDVESGLVSSLEIDGVAPRWTPTGDRLGYTDNTGLIRTVLPDGSDDRVVSSSFIASRPYSWSPDSQWVILETGEGLMMVRVATGQQILLPFKGPESTSLRDPSWRP